MAIMRAGPVSCSRAVGAVSPELVLLAMFPILLRHREGLVGGGQAGQAKAS